MGGVHALCLNTAASLDGVQDGTAVGSLGLDGACSGAVRRACPEAHLLQFARDILGEPVPPEVPISIFSMQHRTYAHCTWFPAACLTQRSRG
jgi:hypothetical protein